MSEEKRIQRNPWEEAANPGPSEAPPAAEAEPLAAPAPAEPAEAAESAPQGPVSSKNARRKRPSYSLTLDPELLEALRDAAYWAPGETISGIIEAAAAAYLPELAKAHGHQSGRFPSRDGQKVKIGRPPKS